MIVIDSENCVIKKEVKKSENVCPRCGTQARYGVKRCRKCGFKVDLD